jgi:hypothetical protein
MDMMDRVFIATLLTLALAVLILERRKMMTTIESMTPPAGNDRLTKDLNVPDKRDNGAVINDVAYLDVTDAAKGEFQ